MTLVLPDQRAPWWAILLLTLVGAAVGVVLTRTLADGRYRQLDERDQPLPRHTWWLVIAVAFAWGALTFRFGGFAQWSLLPAYLYLGVIGPALILTDFDVHRLPDLIVLPSYVIAFVLLLVPTVVVGDWGAMLRAVLAGLALYAFYFVQAIALPERSGLGFGDVKLAGVLGLLVGWVGWGSLFISVMATAFLGGLAALFLIPTRLARFRSWRRAVRVSFAYGPWMVLGTMFALMFPVRVLTG
jgi:leader peptidase (prepilin peptidase)/N-methyltransferase